MSRNGDAQQTSELILVTPHDSPIIRDYQSRVSSAESAYFRSDKATRKFLKWCANNYAWLIAVSFVLFTSCRLIYLSGGNFDTLQTLLTGTNIFQLTYQTVFIASPLALLSSLALLTNWITESTNRMTELVFYAV